MRRVDILELKYCRDTEPYRQTARAAGQHAHFVERLLRQGYRAGNVRYHTIVLGVSGTIYKAMYAPLRKLGVSKPNAKRLASKLHHLAAQYVEIIMNTKWNQEHLATRAADKTGVG